MQVPPDWYRTFFSGVAVELWRQAMPEAHSRLEVDCIERLLELPPQARVLDVPCGHGRHALELAARGHRVSGVDLSSEDIQECHARAAARGLEVTWRHGDMRELPWQNEFDGAFCFGNSFGYLEDDAADAAFVAAVHRALKPGGRFALETGAVAESLLTDFHERRWWQIGDLIFLVKQTYDPARGRVDAEYSFIRGGQVETRPISQRVYPYRELCRMLTAAGFSDCQGYSSMQREAFKLGSQSLYLVAAKRA